MWKVCEVQYKTRATSGSGVFTQLRNIKFTEKYLISKNLGFLKDLLDLLIKCAGR